MLENPLFSLTPNPRSFLLFTSLVYGTLGGLWVLDKWRGMQAVGQTGRVLGALGTLVTVLLYTFLNEFAPLFAPTTKSYSADVFWFICSIVGLIALATMRTATLPSRPVQAAGSLPPSPPADQAVLSRDQTNEWRGWMQFMFILYHYQRAEPVYNAIRVFVSAYVWLTGFGNVSFFYMRRNYSPARLFKMLWRLNFLVLCLMAVHGTEYILYYIVPLHSFFFLMVYATMGLGESYNYSKWGIRLKFAALGLILYTVWETEDVFEWVFGWTRSFLGDGALSASDHFRGSLHEWRFRTFLDHYSTWFGMIFALFHPSFSAWLVTVESEPSQRKRWLLKGVPAAGLALALAWWLRNVYVLPKLDYNTIHPYTFFIPVTAFVFFRNLSPWLRATHSTALRAIGKVTLETYLLQHHALLISRQTSQTSGEIFWKPATLLTLIPDAPLMNLLAVSVLFAISSNLLFGVTLTLRDAVMDDDEETTVVLKKTVACFVGAGLFHVVGLLFVPPAGFVVPSLVVAAFAAAAAVVFFAPSKGWVVARGSLPHQESE
jgi:hypothetical protein